MSLRSFLLLTVICVVWALNMIVSRIAVGDLGVPPLWFAALRSLAVGVVMLPWLLPLPAKPLKVALITFAISGGGFALLFIGLKDATASSASVVGLSSAPLTVLFAVMFLGEVVQWRRALGIALTFAGVIVAIASPQEIEASHGLLMVFGSAVVGALGAVFLKTLDLSALRLQAWAGASSTVVLLPLSLALESGQGAATMAAGWPLVACLMFSALGVSVFAHTFYFKLLQTHDANVVAPLTLMTPFFAVMFGIVLTGDEVSFPLVLGGLLAVAGVLVILVRPSAKLFKPLMVNDRV